MEGDFNNQDIQINNNQINNSQQISNNIKPEQNSFEEKVSNKVGEVVIKNAQEKLSKTWIDKYFCCLEFFRKYFNITTNDFKIRFIQSLKPLNKNFINIINDNPDLYGPLWIYTALIIILSGVGSLLMIWQGNNTKNFFNQFVPVATIIIYLFGFGTPLILGFLMKCFGEPIEIIKLICTYGYSFSIYLIVGILCLIPLEFLQWIFLIYATVSSTSLIGFNYYGLLNKLSKNKKIGIIIFVIICQLILFLVLKLYFFKKYKEHVTKN